KDSRYRGPAALLPDLVVPRYGRVEHRDLRVAVLAVSHRTDEPRAGRATDVFAAVDRIAGTRASTDRRGAARQPWSEPARGQEPRVARRDVAAGRRRAQAVQ